MAIDIALSATIKMHKFFTASVVVSDLTTGISSSSYSMGVKGSVDSMLIGETYFTRAINDNEENIDERNKEEKKRKTRSN